MEILENWWKKIAWEAEVGACSKELARDPMVCSHSCLWKMSACSGAPQPDTQWLASSLAARWASLGAGGERAPWHSYNKGQDLTLNLCGFREVRGGSPCAKVNRDMWRHLPSRANHVNMWDLHTRKKFFYNFCIQKWHWVQLQRFFVFWGKFASKPCLV